MRINQGKFVVIFYTNIKSIRSSIDPNYGTFVNLQYIASLFSLLRAMDKLQKKIESGDPKLKNIQMEICYHLSPSKNMKEILKVSQIDSGSTHIAIILDSSTTDIEAILSGIDGEEVDANLLQMLLDDEKIKFLIDYFKLCEEEFTFCSFEDAVAMRLAVKDA